MEIKLAPLRVDFGGGWRDVPRFAKAGTYIVNCAIAPLVTLDNWPYQKNSGLGGSAAWRLLNGEDPVQGELKAGAGWQDPAVIVETGWCAWASGPTPKLVWDNKGTELKGLMALLWTGKPHDTIEISNKPRNFELIDVAGNLAFEACLHNNVEQLFWAVETSYQAQRQEGMDDLPKHEAAARKYCGSGFGGYALYLFWKRMQRDIFVRDVPNTMAIEPYAIV